MQDSGDSTLIISPKGKKILIDGGEEDQNILIPYLLARKIKKLDYIIISHFDSDHCGEIKDVLENLKVKKLIISKQIKKSEECNEIIEIAKIRKIQIIFVEAGMELKIERNLSFFILWPENNKQITENPLNNNSIVTKLIYNKFQMLFTGDIEQIAEERLVSKYDQELKANILKVAHHGSKTSSTEEFINKVQPKIALIGVGKNNNYGHPNNEVIKRLTTYGAKIYRTDENGEVSIMVNSEGNIRIKKFIE